LQKREESSLSYAGAEADSKVVDFAQVFKTPVSPPPAMYIYGASIFLALLLTIGLVYGKELLNTKVLYRYELERLSAFPVIGEIAYKKTNNPIVIEEGKRTFIAEEFRKVRLALSFLGIGEKSKKILVTSSIPGEGKSFIAANLAVSLALTGKKVVLIDLDLNNPSLSRILNVDEEFGVSNYLTGEKEPEEIIKRLAVHENLFFVPPGNLPAGPSELLLNGKVKEIISYLENIFDFVIIDTAPVLVVTDTYLLSDYCDATLYIVRHDYTPKMFIKRIAENNKINPLTNPAIIFNGIKAKGLSKNHYGYGYDYIYEYKQKPIKGRKAKKSVV
jgi:capsular exopolysaccharide synthesis family protein